MIVNSNEISSPSFQMSIPSQHQTKQDTSRSNAGISHTQ